MSRTNDVSKYHYLRFRPFLVIEAFMTPASFIRTEKKGWKKIERSQNVNEVPSVVNRVSLNVLRRAEVIIDIVNGTIIKNRLMGTETGLPKEAFDAETLAHFQEKYRDIVERSRAVWQAQTEVDRLNTMIRTAVA